MDVRDILLGAPGSFSDYEHGVSPTYLSHDGGTTMKEKTEEFMKVNDVVDDGRVLEQNNEGIYTRLENSMKKNHGRPMSVRELKVFGTKTTKADVIAKEVELVLKATTFGAITEEMYKACCRLSRLGIFQSMNVHFDVAESSEERTKLLDSMSGLGDRQVDIVLKLEEKPRIWGQTGTTVGYNEGGIYGSINMRNVFGRGERLQTNLGIGTKTHSTFQVAFSKPLIGRFDHSLNLIIHQLRQSYLMQRSYEEILRGVCLNYALRQNSNVHQWSYQAEWREIGNLPEQASLHIRSEAGHSLKSSLKYAFTYSRLDDPILPSQGFRQKFVTEYAGLAGDVSFLRNETETFASVSIGKGVCLSATMSLGSLIPFGKNPSHISDRFFLGGPMTLRGFRMDGVSPHRHSQNESCGGDMYYLGGLALTIPMLIKKFQDWPVRFHMFTNTGSLSRIANASSSSWRLSFGELVKTPRVSVGLGLVIHAKVARVELNYSWPLVASSHDFVRRGFQVGLGMTFI